jgi:nitrite reductase/ring-hydroxylating ferredoxin subunit
MSGFVKIATRAELPALGDAKEFQVGDKLICIANIDGQYAAMENVCVHHGGPLGQGVVDRGKVICPWHGWQFDPYTGVPLQNPTLRVQVYALKIEGDDVLVRLP